MGSPRNLYNAKAPLPSNSTTLSKRAPPANGLVGGVLCEVADLARTLLRDIAYLVEAVGAVELWDNKGDLAEELEFRPVGVPAQVDIPASI